MALDVSAGGMFTIATEGTNLDYAFECGSSFTYDQQFGNPLTTRGRHLLTQKSQYRVGSLFNYLRRR